MIEKGNPYMPTLVELFQQYITVLEQNCYNCHIDKCTTECIHKQELSDIDHQYIKAIQDMKNT